MRGPVNTEVQDIIVLFGEKYRRTMKGRITSQQYKVMRAIESCRTAKLGGHKDKCDFCGTERISYNSCRNRHCPKCQFLKTEQWLEQRCSELLPIQYFHLVFTLPDTLNSLVLSNQREMHSIMFQSVSETLKALSFDKRYLGAKTGFLCVLHTWGQNLQYHPHIHCIITGGGLSEENTWINSRSKFLFPVKVMSRLFRGKYLDYLKKTMQKGKLKTNPGKERFLKLLNSLYRKEWVVYSKPPFKDSQSVLRYLSRYTHRITISNYRIVKIENDKVYFKWRDYADDNKEKVMSLEAVEFIRRFLLHVLPDKFVKIRYYGLFSNKNRKKILSQCRKALHIDYLQKKPAEETWQQRLLRLTGFDVKRCPSCKKGNMICVEELSPLNCNSP